jgi:hypothetical protein
MMTKQTLSQLMSGIFAVCRASFSLLIPTASRLLRQINCLARIVMVLRTRALSVYSADIDIRRLNQRHRELGANRTESEIAC